MFKKIIFFLFKPKKMFEFRGENTDINFLNWFNNPQNISIGNHSYVNYGNTFFAGDFKIKIGDACHIAMSSLFITYSHHFNAKNIQAVPYDKRYVGGDIIINDGTWICARSTILPGVTIGKGCVIAAGSVVSKNVPDYEIWGGNPAKKIGERQNKDLFEKLYKDKRFKRKM